MITLKLKLLFGKYVDNTISKSELKELLSELREVNLDEVSTLVGLSKETIDGLLKEEDISDFDQDKIFRKLRVQLNLKKEKSKKIINTKFWGSIAASLLIVLGIYIYSQAPLGNIDLVAHEDVVLPDKNHATITLVDGKKYSLLHSDKDFLEKEGIQLIKDTEGDVVFKIHPTAEANVVFRTFNAAKGMHSKVILADGTTVFLNSGSKLTYPSQFSSTGRNVSIQGEVFFDVTHDKKNPFTVFANKTTIKVLGTRFNIATNILENKVLTTLVSGRVEVGTRKRKDVIKPGIQSVSDDLSGDLVHKEVFVEDVLAWKEGYFRFNEDDIGTVLDKIKNWYEITDYEIKGLSKDHFTGSVRRTHKLSDLLTQLEKISSYKFKIVERRVIVMS